MTSFYVETKQNLAWEEYFGIQDLEAYKALLRPAEKLRHTWEHFTEEACACVPEEGAGQSVAEGVPFESSTYMFVFFHYYQ